MKTSSHQNNIKSLPLNLRHFQPPLLRVRNTGILLASSIAFHAIGAESQPGNPLVPTEAFDELWSHASLYKDEHNPILQEFKLRGRYQGQY